MKYLVWIALFAAGLTVGYLVGTNDIPLMEDNQVSTTEFVKETIHDTIIQTETVEVVPEIEDNDTLFSDIDTLLTTSDSLIVVEEVDSNEVAENISIRTEKMVGYKWINVTIVGVEEAKDSLIKEMLDIKDKYPSKLKVEFWESPLNFTGYKLSRSKLVLYGMPSQSTYKIYRKKDKYYLSAQTFYYSLKETEEFLPYLEVSKDVIFND
ncbi:MAG: hypothetical protein R2780_10860 [Crocinitomicaceae bacterium]|nr:hypothetical protein [Crocinitomicaceae bacterium]